jgi:hypothetical protein
LHHARALPADLSADDFRRRPPDAGIGRSGVARRSMCCALARRNLSAALRRQRPNWPDRPMAQVTIEWVDWRANCL